MDERDRAQFWKITAIGILLVVATAVITGLVVANRTAPDTSVAAQAPSASPRAATQTPTLPAATSQTPAVPPAATETPKRSGVPPQEIVSACNRQAAAQAGYPPCGHGQGLGRRQGRWRRRARRRGGRRGRRCDRRRRQGRGQGCPDRRPGRRWRRDSLWHLGQQEERRALPRGVRLVHARARVYGVAHANLHDAQAAGRTAAGRIIRIGLPDDDRSQHGPLTSTTRPSPPR